jgi:foldase protein PrsA
MWRGRGWAGLVAGACVALGAMGCGDDPDSVESAVPPGAVAQVGETTVTRGDLDAWMRFSVQTAKLAKIAGATGVVPDPPSYRRCVAAAKAVAKDPPKGQPRPTDEQFRQQCARQRETLVDSTVTYLVRAAWSEEEAAARGIRPSDREVQAHLEASASRFGDPELFRSFRENADAETRRRMLDAARIDLLDQRLIARELGGVRPVAAHDVRAYYERHPDEFRVPEQRDVHIVLTKTKARTEAAIRRLRGGAIWATVARDVSIDGSKRHGGRIAALRKGAQPETLDRVFSVPAGRIAGPIQTPFGWYAFEVDRIRPAHKETFASVESRVRERLADRRRQAAEKRLGDQLQARWRARTRCAEGFDVPQCARG